MIKIKIERVNQALIHNEVKCVGMEACYGGHNWKYVKGIQDGDYFRS